MPLEPENQRLLTAAEGFLELDMPLDANNEIESMAPEVRHVPEVLAVRVGIYRALEVWPLMQTVAKQLALHAPDDPDWTVAWAYATRRTDSLESARLILVNAAERLPGVAVFHFNLACYAAQLGELDRAKASLSRAIELQPGYRQQALEDEDLRPIWETL
jgi:tetratricopeptide (TPR) repeat protein